MKTVKIGYYYELDWERFISTIDDKDSMHSTWKEWYSAYIKTRKNLELSGFTVVDIVINIDTLSEYCKQKGVKNDGKTRAIYVSEF